MLSEVLEQLRAVHRAIPIFESSALRPQLPIIDDSHDVGEDKDPIQGLAHFRDRVKSEIDFIAKFVGYESAPVNEPNTNAPNLIAVWNEIIVAPQPVLAIGKTFDVGGKPVKVDVVCDNGRQWIRVNTIKNSRLLVEFREQDSYLTDSDSESEVLSRSDNPVDPVVDGVLRNSVITMCEQLLEAARKNVSQSTGVPVVRMRLTRLDATLGDDERIAQTINIIREMAGLVIEQGERTLEAIDSDFKPALQVSSVVLEPTQDINLDLSVLVALVSDTTHASLPSSAQGAKTRFRVSRRLHKGDGTQLRSGNRTTDQPSETHLNALASQVVQESACSIVDAIIARSTPTTRFWVTAHARDRCIKIVERIGGRGERRRCEALLQSANAELFWSESRHASYPSLERIPLIPLHVLQDENLVPISKGLDDDSQPSFFRQATLTCDYILSHSGDVGAVTDASETAQKTGIAKLTVHTVQSLAAGAHAQMTTLTANKTSVRSFLREMRAAGHVPAAVRSDAGKCAAAVWIIDPRSLSEGMRADVVI